MSVVLITGCSSGLGLETALAFARRGDVTYATMRDLSRADDLVRRAKEEDLDVELRELDVNDDVSVAEAVADVEARHGAVDVLVNNAAIDYSGPVETIDLAKARTVMETNFWGPVRTIRAVLPAMRERGQGVIVNVSSVSARMPGTPYWSWYSASKHALNAVTDALYIELEGFGVRVVCVEPGFFKTDIIPKSIEQADIDVDDPYASHHAWLARYYMGTLDGPVGDPAEVASVVVDAATDQDTPVHVLVGQDAAMVVDMVRGLPDMEAWRPAAVAHASTIAGPRPPR